MLAVWAALVSLSLACGCGARTALRVGDAGADELPRLDVDTIDVRVPEDGSGEEASDIGDVVGDDVPPSFDVALDAPLDVPVDGPVARCGNGALEPGELCDEGFANALTPAFAVTQPGRSETPVAFVARPRSALAFYDYRSASAHTGFEVVRVSNFFLYVSTPDDTLSLFIVTGQDFEGGPTRQPVSAIQMTLRGVPSGAQSILSDDPGEVRGIPPADVTAGWTFQDNSDGSVISGLAWDRAWTITLDANFMSGVSSWRYAHERIASVSLDLTQPGVLIHRIAGATCRPDCRPPRCGDGFVDAGERCDDGNTRSNDGCSAACDRVE